MCVCVCVQAPPHGLSYDQSQVGMLSISFLDATQYPSVPHLSHPHPSHPHPPPLPRNVDLSVASLDHSLLPVSLSNLPALQGARVMCLHAHIHVYMYMYIFFYYTEGLSHLHDAVTALLQHYISLSAEVRYMYTYMYMYSTCKNVNKATILLP